MLITSNEELEKYASGNRLWQGIPGIEITKGGRIFSTFYSGGTREEIGNYSVLVMSDDGVSFSDPIAVAYSDNCRCFDPCVWIDPLDRLWFIWSVMPECSVYASICEKPDAEKLQWGKEFLIGNEVMLNKPTVLSTGEWLFPIAVWKKHYLEYLTKSMRKNRTEGSLIYRSTDLGRTFHVIGNAHAEKGSFDEHMILEQSNGRLAVYIRAVYGIAVSYSYDGGKTWTPGEDSKLGGPNSRFAIRRLKSGRVLLINHYKFSGRNNLTAFLSEDDGETWKYSLLIDERNDVSYPDVAEGNDGYIYITYDRERGGFKKSLEEAYSCAREILYAKITEDDIIKGKIVTKGSSLKRIISKLGLYEGKDKNPFSEIARYSEEELAEHLIEIEPINAIDKIFDYYSVNCINMKNLQNEKLDKLVNEYKNTSDKKQKLIEIITLVRAVSSLDNQDFPVVDKVRRIIAEDISYNIPINEIAAKAGVSMYYMMHLFKKTTGTTINKYKNALRLSNAKKMLMSTDKSITDIAVESGFGDSSYFAKMFMKSEGISPSDYRKLLQPGCDN